MWKKFSEKKPPMETVLHIKEAGNGFKRMGNWFYSDETGYNLHIQTNGAYEGWNISQDKVGFDDYMWLDESNDEVEQLRAKVEFYREATDKVRELVSKSNDIGKPCQPLYDAIVDKINDLQSQLNKYWEALEKIASHSGEDSFGHRVHGLYKEVKSIATEALTPQP